MCQKIQLIALLITILVFTTLISPSTTESRNFNTGYGFSGPINVGGETSFGVGSSYSSGSLGRELGSTNSFSSGYNGLNHGLGYGSNSLGFGFGTSSFPGINSHNSFNHHGLGQNSGGFYGSVGYGGNFYPGNGLFGNGFSGFNFQRPYHFGNGVGNYGLHVTGGLGGGIGNGFALGTGYTGIGNNFGSSTGFGGHYGYGANQPFK